MTKAVSADAVSRALILVVAFSAWVSASVPVDGADAETRRFPAVVESVSGRSVDVAALARASTVVVVTLKAHWCPVCQRQLERIKARRAMLEECGTKFIVLAPGPSDQLEAIRDRIGFDAPFVEDKGLRIAESLGLKLSEDEIQPAIFVVEPDLTVGWTQRGRNGGYYGDDALLEEIACARRQRI